MATRRPTSLRSTLPAHSLVVLHDPAQLNRLPCPLLQDFSPFGVLQSVNICRKTSLVETNKYWRNGFVTFSSEKEALHVRIPSSFSSLNSSHSFYPPSLLRRHQFFLLSSSPTPFFSILPSLLLSFLERRIALPRRLFQPEEDFNVEIVAPRTFSDETLT